MKFALATALLAGAAVAAPAPTKASDGLEKRAAMCGQWDSVTTGSYTLYNNLWGESSGSGSQCTTFSSLTSNVMKWSTSWSWSGGSSSVKSYANARITVGKALSAVSKIPSTWNWSYTGSNIVADVAYDMFTGTSASASPSYEIMVWLGALGGAGPISSTGSPVATPTINGVTWNLYKGPNGSMTVFSFVAQSKDQTTYSGDMNLFFTYLEQNQGLSSSQILQTIGAGTEPFTGSNAVLTTSAYSVSVS